MLIIHRRLLRIFFAVVIMSILCAFATYLLSEARDGDESLRIIVDAGHGSPDGGAVGINGSIEKDINLAIATKLNEVLVAKGFDVIMTRSDDNGIYKQNSSIKQMKIDDMHERLKIMKNSGADLFISIHMNSFENKSAEGLRIFYSKNHSEIKPLAESIQSRIKDITGAKTYAVKTADEKLFLMKNPPLASILAECGFISNEEEEKKLVTDEYQSKIAWAIADSIQDFYHK